MHIITRQRAFFLRLDDIQHSVLMIYNFSEIDDIQGFALIYLQKCDITNLPINKNLAEDKNSGIVELVKKQV